MIECRLRGCRCLVHVLRMVMEVRVVRVRVWEVVLLLLLLLLLLMVS